MSETQVKLSPEQEASIREQMQENPFAEGMSPEEYAIAFGEETTEQPQNATPENQDAGDSQESNSETTSTEEDSGLGTETVSSDNEEATEAGGDEEEEVSIFQPKKGAKVSFKDETEAKKYVSEKLGIDISTPAGYAKLVESFNKQRQNAQKATDYEKKLEAFTKALEEMPEPIIKAMEAHNNGEDWKAPLKSVPVLKIDFNKDFDSQDKWALIETYVPDEITKDEFEDDPDGREVQRLLRIAEKAFRLDKQQNDRELAEVQRVRTENDKKFKDSALSSVEAVKSDFPGIEDKDVKRIEKVLLGGGLGSEFFNQDGTYKKDAAKKLALIQYAPAEIDRLTKQVSKLKAKVKELSDQSAEIVSRGRSTVPDERNSKNNLQNPEMEHIPAWLR